MSRRADRITQDDLDRMWWRGVAVALYRPALLRSVQSITHRLHRRDAHRRQCAEGVCEIRECGCPA